MKKNRVLTWAKDARTRVVKQADLDTASMASVRLLTWKDEELVSVHIDPATSSEEVIGHVPILELIARETDAKCELASAVLEVERQWNLPDLDNSEVLDTLAVAYGTLSDLVVDAHAHLGHLKCIDSTAVHSPFRAVHHRSGVIPCMLETSELQKERFSLSTGARILVEPVRQVASVDAVEKAASRYGMSVENRPMLKPGAEPDSVAQQLVYWSKKMLRKDGYHVRVVFVRDGSGNWRPMGFAPAARSEKHVAIRLLAQFVRRTGADAIIDIGEIWLTEIEREIGNRDSSAERRHRRDALQVLVATRNGLLRLYTTPFSKGPFGGIKLEDTRVNDEDRLSLRYLYPVFKVWSDQGTQRGPDGKNRIWLWEPDPLDRCYCGSDRRFGICCGAVLRRYSMSDLEARGREAMARSDLAEAERCAQAAVAQYVIWMKRHTVSSQHVDGDLHEKLLDVDVPAVEAYVRCLDRVFELSGRRADLVARLRYLSEIVGIPEVRVRLIAIAAERLYEIGTRAEAAAELDRIENLEEATDSTALRVAAQVFNRDHEDCSQLLRKAADCARNEHERFTIELELANGYRQSDRVEDAVRIVDMVIGETQGKEELVAPRVAALDLRWRISGEDRDFLNAKRELEGCDGAHMKARLLSMLVDHGDWKDAMEVAFDDGIGEDVIVQMRRVEILVNVNRVEEARQLVRKIPTEQVEGRLRLPYAHTMGFVALHAGDSELAAKAAETLRSIESEEGLLPSESAKMLGALDQVGMNST